MEQYERIRRDARDAGLSIRELATKYQVHRRTVRQALADAVPPARKTPTRASPATGPYEQVVRAWLTADLGAPRKQRHTARRVWQRLVDEHGAGVSESAIRPLVARIKVEVGLDRRFVAIPQHHGPGEQAEVDFGEFRAVIDGVEEKLWMFVMRLSHSGRAVHIAYANQASESFLDGHVIAFDRLGGVPREHIRYDNLTPAVVRVLLGRERDQNARFVALRSHYGFDSFFCQPGLAGAHEKGGVEGEVGRFRRRHLTPVPRARSLLALNERITAADQADDARRIAARRATVGVDGAIDAAALGPMPPVCFDPDTWLECVVDAKARVCVRQSYYSVPASMSGRRITVRLGPRVVRAFNAAGHVVAAHPRSLHKGSEDLVLDHYLEVLARRPGALAGATALVAARAAGSFTPTHQRYWDAARRAHGDSGGTKAIVGVLLLHRTLPAAAVIAGMDAALVIGSYSPDLVAVEARRHLEPDTPPPPPAIAAAHATAGLAQRPAPSLAGYDQLLRLVPDPAPRQVSA